MLTNDSAATEILRPSLCATDILWQRCGWRRRRCRLLRRFHTLWFKQRYRGTRSRSFVECQMALTGLHDVLAARKYLGFLCATPELGAEEEAVPSSARRSMSQLIMRSLRLTLEMCGKDFGPRVKILTWLLESSTHFEEFPPGKGSLSCQAALKKAGVRAVSRAYPLRWGQSTNPVDFFHRVDEVE